MGGGGGEGVDALGEAVSHQVAQLPQLEAARRVGVDARRRRPTGGEVRQLNPLAFCGSARIEAFSCLGRSTPAKSSRVLW